MSEQLKPKAHDLLTWLNEQPFSMAIVTGLTNEDKEFTPSGDYSSYATEDRPCTKCEAGVVTVTVHTKVIGVHAENSTVITAETFFHMREYEQEMFTTLKENGNILPLYRKDDTNEDGRWDTLMKYDSETNTYVEVIPDIEE